MRITNVYSWPEEATRKEWASILGCSQKTLQRAEKRELNASKLTSQSRATTYFRTDILRHFSR